MKNNEIYDILWLLYTNKFSFISFIFHNSSSSVLIRESCSPVTNVSIKTYLKLEWRIIKIQYIKILNIFSQLQREIFLSTKGLCMKESNTLADNVAINLQQRDHWLTTKDLFMKESRPCWSFLAIQCQQNRVIK